MAGHFRPDSRQMFRFVIGSGLSHRSSDNVTGQRLVPVGRCFGLVPVDVVKIGHGDHNQTPNRLLKKSREGCEVKSKAEKSPRIAMKIAFFEVISSPIGTISAAAQSNNAFSPAC